MFYYPICALFFPGLQCCHHSSDHKSLYFSKCPCLSECVFWWGGSVCNKAAHPPHYKNPRSLISCLPCAINFSMHKSTKDPRMRRRREIHVTFVWYSVVRERWVYAKMLKKKKHFLGEMHNVSVLIFQWMCCWYPWGLKGKWVCKTVCKKKKMEEKIQKHKNWIEKFSVSRVF